MLMNCLWQVCHRDFGSGSNLVIKAFYGTGCMLRAHAMTDRTHHGVEVCEIGKVERYDFMFSWIPLSAYKY
jgi:hypothetical protein